MSNNWFHRQLKISWIQWLFIFLISTFLGFFNIFGQLFNGHDGTLANSFTITRICYWILCSFVFAITMLSLLWFNQKLALSKGTIQLSGTFKNCTKFFNNPWKIAAFLTIVWGLFLLPFIPVISGWDFVAQVREMTTLRSADPVNDIYNIYPIGHYLTSKTSSMWSNQHGAILTAFYGLSAKWSWQLAHSFLPAYLFLGITHFGFAIAAYSYALSTFLRRISNVYWKLFTFVLIVFNPIIFLNTISLSKNPLFVSSFVLFMALMVKLFDQNGKVNRTWILSMFLTVLIGIIAVKWAAQMYLVVLIGYLIVYRKVAWKQLLIGIAFPLILMKIIVWGLMTTGVVIADDPIEAKGIQIQQVARYMKEYPHDITDQQRSELNEIFVVDNLGKIYNPNISDPIKSSGYAKFNDKFAMGYRYWTAKPKDWVHFHKIWLSLFAKHPVVFLDAFMAKMAGYFNIRDIPFNDISTTMYADVVGNGYGSLQTGVHRLYNNQFREHASNLFYKTFNQRWKGLLMHGNFWIVLGLLLLPIFLTNWKSFLIELPILLQTGIVILSPVENSQRYALGIMVGVILLMMMLGTKKQNFLLK
ncbi:DUF6020 family protein [Convivina intestini]|uniref:Uncharacterized protein n=1 Tax=Convivina intestini TaxID=1505726 RepID=A0A2U1DC91_9LACO|nr:DUF6020 family protein [Convivina intestini]PVY85288.1 hypothetical protein C7384_102108 [Convivina intestini]CAH1852760.1 hypothetical protein R077811_00506 [Convivina intestini]SDB86699.1 hypothetical protein SAMN05216341_102151 [Leuconostocaceae bacterium R-53105]